MNSKWMVVASLGLVLGVTAGCRRDNPSGTTTTTGGNPTTPLPTTPTIDDNRDYTGRGYEVDRNGDKSGVTLDRDRPRVEENAGQVSMRFNAEVDRIAQARCEREVRCNNVGGDHKYSSRDQCVNAVRTSLRDELNAWDCKGGIDTKELNECLTEIRNEDCGNPLDTIGRLVACRSSDMCKAR